MRRSLLRILRDPENAEPLTLYGFASKNALGEEEDIIEGILIARNSNKAYPVVDGVPIMLEASFPQDFFHKHAKEISQAKALTAGLDLQSRNNSPWSFSTEWDAHFDYDLTKTWGWTAEERVQQFLIET